MKVSIISVAFGEYQKYIPGFIKMASKFSDDIIIETERRPMGEMRNRAIAKAKHEYIISIDIDDELIAVPQVKADFIGLRWLEHNTITGKDTEGNYCLPGERRAKNHTYREHIMFSKKLWDNIKFVNHDYFLYAFLKDVYLSGAKMARSEKICMIYNKHAGSISTTKEIVTDNAHKEARKMLVELERVSKKTKIDNSYDNEIEGWMSKEELNFLYKTAGEMDSVVEIGSWKGRSTHALLSACKGTVTAIDHFQGSPGEQAHIGQKPYDDFKKNVGMFKNLQVLKMSSDQAVNKIGKVDMVFIDGAHTYEAVKNDIEKWLPKANKLICGHDFKWETVRRAVEEMLGSVDVVGSIWYYKVKK